MGRDFCFQGRCKLFSLTFVGYMFPTISLQDWDCREEVADNEMSLVMPFERKSSLVWDFALQCSNPRIAGQKFGYTLPSQ